MTLKKNTQTNITTFDSLDISNENPSNPESLVTITRDILFYAWQLMEVEICCMDPGVDPNAYQAANDRAVSLFESWMSFRCIEGRA